METGEKSQAPSGCAWAKPCSTQELKIVMRLSVLSPAFASHFSPLGTPMDGGLRRSLRSGALSGMCRACTSRCSSQLQLSQFWLLDGAVNLGLLCLFEPRPRRCFMVAFAHAGSGPQGCSRAAESRSPRSAAVEGRVGNLLQCLQGFPAWGLAVSSSILGHLGREVRAVEHTGACALSLGSLGLPCPCLRPARLPAASCRLAGPT